MTETEYIEARVQMGVAPIAEELLEHNCPDCAVDKMLEVMVKGLREMRLDYRQKILASIAINFNLETGEEHGPLQT